MFRSLNRALFLAAALGTLGMGSALADAPAGDGSKAEASERLAKEGIALRPGTAMRELKSPARIIQNSKGRRQAPLKDGK